MILDWIAQDFADLFARDGRACVALWCDAKAEFRELLPDLRDRFASDSVGFLVFDKAAEHGALWLKWATEVGPSAGRRVIVWLPFSREDIAEGGSDGTRLDCLLEYVFGGLPWLIDGKPPTVFGFLKKHDVPLPTQRAEQDPLWRGGPESPLGKYVRGHLQRDDAFWRSRTLTLAVIEESVVGNLEDRLLRFLADPALEWQALEATGIAREFCSQVRTRYANGDTLRDDPDVWASRFVSSMVLLEIFDAAGEPDDFPFRTALPDQAFRPAMRELLRRWMRDRDYLETYRRWALELERKLNVVDWGRSRTGRSQALHGLAADRWKLFSEALALAKNKDDDARTLLQNRREDIVQESKGFWASGTKDLPGWKLAADLGELAERAAAAEKMVAPGQEAASRLVEMYASEWHKIDLAHWRLLAAARRADEMELLAAVADRLYANYLDAVGRAFYGSFRLQRAWPPDGCKSVRELTEDLFRDSSRKRAILVVDAFRFDLAALLSERLGEGTLTAYVANVPSETYVGMTSLLPATEVRLEVYDGKPRLVSQAAGGDLCYRQYRWKLLDAAGAAPLAKEGKNVRRDEIRHLREVTEMQKGLPRCLVLFERGVDHLGHAAGREAIQHFEELLGDLERSIRKLKSLGYSEIHVVTDHGFVLLHDGANVQAFEVDKERFAVFGARSGILKKGEEVQAAIVPFALDPTWQVALPPGLRSFASPGSFFHGGATLQEVVIPHLKIVATVPPVRMGVRVLVPHVDIATMTVRVELVPEAPHREGLFPIKPEPTQVRVFLGTPEVPRSSEKIISVGLNDSDPIAVTLFLNREPLVTKGTEIPVQVIDLDPDNPRSYATGLFVRAARDLG